MKNLISVLGYPVHTFDSAESYLGSEVVRNTSCLITDVQMPGMSGVELQGKLFAGGHRTPIIFVTAYPEETTRERVLRGGAIGYLSKPLREQNLVACLERALDPDIYRPA